MRALCIALILCGACTKKPAAKNPAPPPAEAEEKDPKDPASVAPAPPTPKPGDPCSGGEGH